MQVECQQLCKIYRHRHETVSVLNDVNFTVHSKEFVAIVGPSGCGKTTLLKIIAELVFPTSGRVIFGESRSNERLRNAMVFQEHGLLPWLTTLDNVAFGLKMRGIQARKRRKLSREFLQKVGLSGFVDHYPHQLSVGMRQRTAIARAFVTDPAILLMDEPFSALDAQTKLILREELLRLWGEHHKTVIYVTHDIEEAILLSDRVLVMTGQPGRILEELMIPLQRPRRLLGEDYPEVQELKWHIWKMLEAEVRNSVELSL